MGKWFFLLLLISISHWVRYVHPSDGRFPANYKREENIISCFSDFNFTHSLCCRGTGKHTFPEKPPFFREKNMLALCCCTLTQIVPASLYYFLILYLRGKLRFSVSACFAFPFWNPIFLLTFLLNVAEHDLCESTVPARSLTSILVFILTWSRPHLSFSPLTSLCLGTPELLEGAGYARHATVLSTLAGSGFAKPWHRSWSFVFIFDQRPLLAGEAKCWGFYWIWQFDHLGQCCVIWFCRVLSSNLSYQLTLQNLKADIPRMEPDIGCM